MLVTGHTGFKGSGLLLWLLELGAEVWGYVLEAEAELNLFRQLHPGLLANLKYPQRFHHRQADLASAKSLFSLLEQPPVSAKKSARIKETRGCNR